jgi:hypothetical protein
MATTQFRGDHWKIVKYPNLAAEKKVIFLIG